MVRVISTKDMAVQLDPAEAADGLANVEQLLDDADKVIESFIEAARPKGAHSKPKVIEPTALQFDEDDS